MRDICHFDRSISYDGKGLISSQDKNYSKKDKLYSFRFLHQEIKF